MRAESEAKQTLTNLEKCETSQSDRPYRVGYRQPFRHHPPEVREKAVIHLRMLLRKHSAKILTLKGAASRGYYGILIATATHMAKRDLGLIPSYKENSKKGIYRRRTIAMLASKAGLKDIRPDTIPTSVPMNCEVGQANLDGI